MRRVRAGLRFDAFIHSLFKPMSITYIKHFIRCKISMKNKLQFKEVNTLILFTKDA